MFANRKIKVNRTFQAEKKISTTSIHSLIFHDLIFKSSKMRNSTYEKLRKKFRMHGKADAFVAADFIYKRLKNSYNSGKWGVAGNDGYYWGCMPYRVWEEECGWGRYKTHRIIRQLEEARFIRRGHHKEGKLLPGTICPSYDLYLAINPAFFLDIFTEDELTLIDRKMDPMTHEEWQKHLCTDLVSNIAQCARNAGSLYIEGSLIDNDIIKGQKHVDNSVELPNKFAQQSNINSKRELSGFSPLYSPADTRFKSPERALREGRRPMDIPNWPKTRRSLISAWNERFGTTASVYESSSEKFNYLLIDAFDKFDRDIEKFKEYLVQLKGMSPSFEHNIFWGLSAATIDRIRLRERKKTAYGCSYRILNPERLDGIEMASNKNATLNDKKKVNKSAPRGDDLMDRAFEKLLAAINDRDAARKRKKKPIDRSDDE